MPENECSADMFTFVPEAEWGSRLLTIQGSLAIAVLTLIIMGVTGLAGNFAKLVGPVTVTPLLFWLTLGVIPTLHEKMSLHWISIVLNLLPSNYYDELPRERQLTNTLLLFGEEKMASNKTAYLWAVSRQFGLPQVSFGLMLGFLASCVASTMESVGDYHACARVSHQRSPPSSSVNRAIIFEGIGSLSAAVVGLGAGVTTYAENIGLMQFTKVVSRSTMQVAGILLIFAGLFTKCAAVLASIPDAVIGGVLCMGLAMITGVAFSNLQKVDLSLTRNTTIMGTALLLGALVPFHFERNRVNFGIKSIDDCLNMLLRIRMLIAGLTAFVLDNTVSGATREQRGFVCKDADVEVCGEEDGYAFPLIIRRFLLRYPILCKLPFLPSEKSLLFPHEGSDSKNYSSRF
ncbi:putative permease [Oesophagostomum dentatum]|uniref:Putative permease n=1 Tax=Oesophagostomum dentatum TaxID=61180 RepID=A0A0B1THS1_OESDE|nr:putative permease [Oesophagostomum dentatum]